MIKVPQYSGEHNEVEDFENTYVKESTDNAAFHEFLRVPDDRLPLKESKAKKKFTLGAFKDAANILAKSMRDMCECPSSSGTRLFSPTFNPTCRV
jgi:hypothetical protein